MLKKGVIILIKKISVVFLVLLFLILNVGCKKNPQNFSSGELLNSGVIKVDVNDDDDTSNTSSDNSNSSDSTDNTASNEDNSSQNNTSNGEDSSKPNSQSKPANNSNPDGSSKPQGNNEHEDNSNTDNSSDSDDTNDSSKIEETNKSEGNPDDTSTPDNNSKKEYESIVCRPFSEIVWKKINIVVDSIKFNVRLSVPNDWEISKDGSIIKSGNVIGKITTKSPNSVAQHYEGKYRGQVDNSDINIKTSIYKKSDNSFKRLFSVSRLLKTEVMKYLYIDVNYSEIDSDSANKIYEQLSYLGNKTSIPLADSSKSKNIIILGGLSISEEYAKIKSFLGYMCETSGKSGYNFEMINKPKSTAISNFANDSQLIEKIKKGEYMYVIQSGFDTKDNIENFKIIYDACLESNTKLIILPSFDDDMEVVQKLLDKYEKNLIINLKSELNNLIDSSVGTDKILTANDIINEDNRLTKHAGFITAHMIYRNIFGEVPPVINSNELAYTEIQSKFPENYLTSGIIPGQENVSTYYLQ